MKLRQRLVLAGAAVILLALGRPTDVFAHAELIGSEPADRAVVDRAPERVQLLFSEPIEPEFFALQVYAADRSRVDRGDARISPTDPKILEAGLRDLGAGPYTVVWRVLSLDGHVVRGSFAFAVGAGSAPARPIDLALPAEGAPFPLESAVRWLTFLSGFVLLGGFAFWPLVFRPAFREAGLDGSTVEATLLRRWLWLAWPALVLLLILSFAALLIQAASAAGVPVTEVLNGRAVTRLLGATRYGWLWGLRMALLIALVGLLAWLSVSRLESASKQWGNAAALSALVLLTLSGSGHAGAVQSWVPLAITADWAHMVAGGIWIGGLVQLGFALPAALRTAEVPDRRRLLGPLVARFSRLAGVSVGVLVLTGIYASLLHVPSWTALLDTSYGAALSGKLLVFAPLLAFAAVNLLVMGPRFRRAGPSGAKARDDAGGRRAFRLLVLGEIALVVAVLGITGVLTGLPPASSLALEARPFSETQRMATAAVTLAVRPNQAGENRIAVTLVDQRGAPLADAERVRLTLTMLDMEMGTREAEMESIGPGQYQLQGNQLSMTGQWQADVTVRHGGTDEQARFAFVVGQAPGADRPAFSPARIVLNAVNAGSFLALVALGGAALILIRLGNLRRRDRRWAVAAASMLAVLGVGVGGVTVADAYRRSLPNPVAADAASIARGQEIYQAQCATCHGITGRGDGPTGRLLRPRPADLRAHMAAGHTDPELFEWVTNGVPGTAMPGFGSQLSERERWDVINYIRTFAEQ